MLTEEEKTEIIDKAVEKALLMLPKVVGNLMAEQAELAKLNKELYSKNPDFKGNEQVVKSVVEQIDSENPGLRYEDILKKSIPIIKERIKTSNSLDLENVSSNINRDVSSLKIEDAKRPSLNGEI